MSNINNKKSIDDEVIQTKPTEILCNASFVLIEELNS
ncbi:hypothetical protein REIS_0973 [Rickettsia endosymbiont of Ixodes scapularis]|nr:hypothetical protein REIS_0973 [Rickettsia endosymbiont of Ixodes scapularis]